MVVYIALFILICFLGIFLTKVTIHNKLFLFCAFLLMALLLGLRGSGVGEDTKMYLSVANASSQISWHDLFMHFPKSTWAIDDYGYQDKIETMFLLYNKVIMSISHNAQWVLMITALITCFGFAKFIYDNTSEVFMATYVFMCEAIYMNCFNVTRQCMAAAIAINSYTYFKKGKYLKPIVLILAASLFHQSALIYLILILLVKIKNRRGSIKYILAGCIAIPFLAPQLEKLVSKFSSYYSTYLQTSFWESKVHGTLLIWTVEIILGIYVYYTLGKKNSNTLQNLSHDVLTNIMQDDYVILSCVIIYLGIEALGLQFTAISRVALYFRVFIILYFPMALKYMHPRNKTLYKVLIYSILFFEFISYASTDTRIYSYFWQH